MKIADKIQQATKQIRNKLKHDENFQNLENFYKAMQEQGIAKKPEYTLPQLDTIGRRLIETTHRK